MRVGVFAERLRSNTGGGVKDVFDASYYADSYADLKEAFGYDENALLQHYMTYGLNEGRSASTVFNVAAYRAAYADLEAAFGDDWNAYVNHYYTYGITEGRTAGVSGESNPGALDSTPVDSTAGQQAPVQPSGSVSEIWLGEFDSDYNGVFNNNGTPVNVGVDYTGGDCVLLDNGYESRWFEVVVWTEGTPIDAQTLVNAIGFDPACVQNLVPTYRTDNHAKWNCDINYNGVVYKDCEIEMEWSIWGTNDSETETDGVTADYWITVPEGCRLTATVQLDANTVVKKYK
ncbi:MAG: hypothetical protein HDR15_00695 [Lachnospiraceae bacterium]|nr:hypothetical protein [Lachnospiraceae bacterium]